MPISDIALLTDAELCELRIDVLTEQERRTFVVTEPLTAADLASSNVGRIILDIAADPWPATLPGTAV